MPSGIARTPPLKRSTREEGEEVRLEEPGASEILELVVGEREVLEVGEHVVEAGRDEVPPAPAAVGARKG